MLGAGQARQVLVDSSAHSRLLYFATDAQIFTKNGCCSYTGYIIFSEIVQLPGNRILLRDRYMEDNEPEYSTYSIFQLKFR